MQRVMCGSATTEVELNPYSVTEPAARQRILNVINRRRSSPEAIAHQLGCSRQGVLEELQALEHAGLVVRAGDTYKPAFAIFTLDDQKRLQPLIRVMADAYSGAAPAGNGVDICEAFTPLHHAFFEACLKQLMQKGVLPCPTRRPDGARYAVWLECTHRA